MRINRMLAAATSLALAGAATLASAAGIDVIDFNTAIPTVTNQYSANEYSHVTAAPYSTIAHRGYFAIGSGQGLDHGVSAYEPSWNQHVTAKEYTSVSTVASNSAYVFAAGPSGVDLWTESGVSWVATPVTASSYNSVASSAQSLFRMFASRDGGMDWFNWNGASWDTLPVNTNSYKQLSTDRGIFDRVYGLRTDGQIDFTKYDPANPTLLGSAHHTELVDSAGQTYLAVAAGRQHNVSSHLPAMAIRSDGGLDLIIGEDDFDFEIFDVSSTNYLAVVSDGLSLTRFYASRASGGIDQIDLTYVFDPEDPEGGVWSSQVTNVLSTGLYSSLGADTQVSGNIFGVVAVPEPATFGVMGLSAVGILLRRRRRH